MWINWLHPLDRKLVRDLWAIKGQALAIAVVIGCGIGMYVMSKGMLMEGVVAATSIATSDTGYGDLAVGGAAMASQLITMKYGRSAELESDQYGMRIMSRAGYDPQGAVELQETFVRLSEGQDQDWISGFFASHPPSNERVKANRKTAKELPPGGRLGVESYQAVMQKTLTARPAYDAYDKGREALGEADRQLDRDARTARSVRACPLPMLGRVP